MAERRPLATAEANPDGAPAVAEGSGATTARRRRRWPWLLAALVVLLLALAAGLARLLEPERLSALLLDEAGQRTGLVLSVAEPAQVSFWPDLHIRLEGLRAAPPGEGTPMLVVGSVELVLPWSALLQRQARIRALRLRQPVLDRDRFADWLHSRPRRDGADLQLPELTADLVVIDGSVVASGQANAWQLHELALETTALKSGRPFRAAGSGTLQLGDTTLVGAVDLQTVPVSAAGGLVLDPLRLVVRDGDGQLVAEAAGQARWGPADALSLALEIHPGVLPQRVADWLPPTADAAPARTSVAYEGTTSLAGGMVVELRHANATAAYAAQPARLLQWWSDAASSPLPPGAGTLAAATLQLPGVQLHGVHLELQDAEADAGAGAADRVAADDERSR